MKEKAIDSVHEWASGKGELKVPDEATLLV